MGPVYEALGVVPGNSTSKATLTYIDNAPHVEAPPSMLDTPAVTAFEDDAGVDRLVRTLSRGKEIFSPVAPVKGFES